MNDSLSSNHVEWSAVEEGFRLLARDLGKLQVGQYMYGFVTLLI